MLVPQLIVPTLLVPLIGYRLYRRFRSNIGRQTLQPTRMVVRMCILAAVVVLFGVIALRSVPALEAVGGGLLAGVLLGVIGVRLTRFEADANGRYYTPNSYIGAGVTLLLVGRLVYRMTLMYSAPQFAPPPGADPFATLVQSPLTLAMAMLTVGYYLSYTAGVLYKSKSPQSPGG